MMLLTVAHYVLSTFLSVCFHLIPCAHSDFLKALLSVHAAMLGCTLCLARKENDVLSRVVSVPTIVCAELGSICGTSKE